VRERQTPSARIAKTATLSKKNPTTSTFSLNFLLGVI
jgi:hypothetical protein